MATQPVEYLKFNGYTPGVDRRRVAEPYVVDGRNYMVTLDGPASLFGRTWLFADAVAEARGMQFLRGWNTGEILYCCGDSINLYDATSRQLYPVFTHTTRTEFWPWTRAIVGNRLYLANKEIGLVQYDPSDGTWRIITGASVPTTVYACCESAGRLVLLGATAVHWSSIDDGQAAGFVPSTATGAGFQVLSKIASSVQPLMVLPFAAGFLVYTSGGIMRAEEIDAQNPFRHRVISREHRILNAWCAIRFTTDEVEQQLMLTTRGLFITDGMSKPTAWQALMSEDLHLSVLPALNTNYLSMTTRLEYNFDTAWLTLSVADDSRNAIYSRAFVLYVPSDQWGIYSRTHCGFGEVYTETSDGSAYRFGVVNSTGDVFWFSFGDADRRMPSLESGTVIDYKTPADVPARWAGSGTAIMPSQMVLTDEPVWRITHDRTGVFDWRYELSRNESPDTNDEPSETPDVVAGVTRMRAAGTFRAALVRYEVAPLLYDEAALDASITIGVIRFPQEQHIDQLAQSHDLIVSMLDSGLVLTLEDYIVDYDDAVTEDWLTESGDEDWGTAGAVVATYGLTLYGTLDGYTTWTENDIAQEVVPELIKTEGKSKHYAGTCTGMYLLAEITASEPGQFFHLKALRMRLVGAGKVL